MRLLHGLGRYSEDLDFSALGEAVPAEVVNSSWKEAIRKALLKLEISNTEVSIASDKVVMNFDVRWAGILYELGVAPVAGQKLSIKVEIDNNPPKGAEVERQMVSKPSLMAITTYDLPSLMAGKVHALLARPYTKGRDWYDLLWYSGNGVEPNTTQLGNALEQIPSKWCSDPQQWRESLMTKAESTNWAVVKQDVERFLENSSELELLERETILVALSTPKAGD